MYRSSLRRFLSPVLSTLAAFAVLGCASAFNPYIDSPRLAFDDVDVFDDLDRAAVSAETLRKKVVQYRSETVTTRTILGYTTFGAAAIGGVGALYDAHTDFILGAGLVATSSYTGGNLFFAQTKEQIYNAADIAMECAISSADSVIAVGQNFEDVGDTYDDAYNELVELLGLAETKWSSSPSTAQTAALITARTARGEFIAVTNNAALFAASDASFARITTKAVTLVKQAMNAKLANQMADLETIFNAARNVPGASIGYVNFTTPDQTETASFLSLTAADVTVEALNRASAELTKISVAITAKITSATNTMNTLATRCVLQLPDITPLGTTTAMVDIVDEQILTLTVTGGKLPITPTWSGENPDNTKLRVVTTAGRDVILVAGKDLPKDKVYTLIIRDSMATPNPVEIKIKTPKT